MILLGPTPDPVETQLLVVVLLLAIWLLLRVRRSENEGRRRRMRRAPTTADELAREVFAVARTADIDGYRELFLAGFEAAQLMGGEADSYLDKRSLSVLEESLVTLGALIPEGSVYGGVEQTGPDAWAMWVSPPVGERFLVGIGTVAKAGVVLRLRDPAFS